MAGSTVWEVLGSLTDCCEHLSQQFADMVSNFHLPELIINYFW